MNPHTQKLTILGPIGLIEIALDQPLYPPDAPEIPKGVALVAHPHPLFGGTLDNKVTQTLARACVQVGLLAVRVNFRGVGQTTGSHDNGQGETDDMLAVLEYIWSQNDNLLRHLPLVLAGFSFGSFVQSQVAQRLQQQQRTPLHLVFLGTAVTRWPMPEVPPALLEHTLLIHGELDDTVPLTPVLDWARPQGLPVVVIPGADHFFHKKLTLLKRLVVDALMVALLPQR